MLGLCLQNTECLAMIQSRIVSSGQPMYNQISLQSAAPEWLCVNNEMLFLCKMAA